MTEQTLIHGVFNPTSVVRTNLQARLSAYGYNRLDQFRWNSSEEALNFTNNSEVAVVLYATLGSLQSTFDFYWNWAAEQLKPSYRWPHLYSDSALLRMWDNADFDPNTLQWVTLELNANYGKSSETVRKSAKETRQSLPGCEILAALAEHPKRTRSMNGSATRPHLNMAGLESKIPGGLPWESVPCTWYMPYSTGLELGVALHSFPNSLYSVPCFYGNT